MNPLQIIAGVVAGIVGAAVWAAMAYFAHVEVGYVAWGIGILVGAAVAGTGKNGSLSGIAAVIITIVAILAGKLGAVELMLNDAQGEWDSWTAELVDPNMEVGDDDLLATFAGRIASEREEAGQTIEWPDAGDDATAEETYPADIWSEAQARLAQRTDEEKSELRAEYRTYMAETAASIRSSMNSAARKRGFFGSFGPFDLLFFGLGIATAWGIASREE